jgi:hypothetical protein
MARTIVLGAFYPDHVIRDKSPISRDITTGLRHMYREQLAKPRIAELPFPEKKELDRGEALFR